MVTIRAEGEEVFHSRLPRQSQVLKKLIERLFRVSEAVGKKALLSADS
jgi:hypothetical protein